MDFARIAPFLTHPLALVGYALFLFFSVHRVLIRSGLLQPLSSTASNRVVQLLLKYGFAIAITSVVAGFALEAVERLSPSKRIASYTGYIDSYDEATKFSKFIGDNIGKVVHIDIQVEEPYLADSDCDFALRTSGPENPTGAEPNFVFMGEDYCIQDANGEFATPDKPHANYKLTMHRNNLRFEGFFSVLGDIEGGHAGFWPVGLIPVSREFGHDRTATNG